MGHLQVVLSALLGSEFKMEIALTVVINHKIVWHAQIKIVHNVMQDTFYNKMDLAKLVIKL